MNGGNHRQTGKKMLKIETEKVEINGNIQKCFDFLCDLNNYYVLFPKDKISNWESDKDSCSVKLLNVYKLVVVKDEFTPYIINLKSDVTSPFEFTLKVVLTEINPDKFTATIHCNAKVNSILKMMIKKPLIDLFDHMAKKIEIAIATV